MAGDLYGPGALNDSRHFDPVPSLEKPGGGLCMKRTCSVRRFAKTASIEVGLMIHPLRHRTGSPKVTGTW
jgi:hypothetical protein